MSVQRLGPKRLRAIERDISEPVLRGWSNGIHDGWFQFVTPDHRHGAWNTNSHQALWGEPDMHYTSCTETWPDD